VTHNVIFIGRRILMNTRKPIIRMAAAVVVFGVLCFLYLDLEKARAMQSAPSSSDLTMALYRTGLDPQSLTAAGLTAQQVGNLVSDVVAYMSNNPFALANADNAHETAKVEYERLQRLVQSGTYAQADLTAYATATSLYSTAVATRQASLDAVREAGVADLSEAQRSKIMNIQSNQEWETPLEFMVINRTQSQWVQLREALAHERIALERNQQVDPAIATLLSQLRVDSAVSTAKANLQANSVAISTAWNEAVSD
jgi:hypothetical protein